eukprot:m.42119 g.42119  ORF g.42119 m.42119 type:complete len:75 (+) comp6226_c0_seq1:189-413(+)
MGVCSNTLSCEVVVLGVCDAHFLGSHLHIVLHARHGPPAVPLPGPLPQCVSIPAPPRVSFPVAPSLHYKAAVKG